MASALKPPKNLVQNAYLHTRDLKKELVIYSCIYIYVCVCMLHIYIYVYDCLLLSFAPLQLGQAVGTEVTQERAMVKLKCHDPSKSNSQDQAFKSELNQGYPREGWDWAQISQGSKNHEVT